jgi:DNA-binding transcriptional LysR family regulator
MHSMDWDDLRFFLAVYRCGSSNAAARKLRVQHTTVGRRLAALEATLGERLFIRTPEGLTPTEAAVAIAPSAEEAERCFLAIERQVRRADSGIEGTVRLTTSEAFGGYLIRHLAKLQSRYPNLTVEIDTSNAVRDLARGEADIAVRMVPTVQSELTCRRIGEAGWSLFGSTDYIARRGLPDIANGLAGHDVIGFGESLAESPGARWLGANAKCAHIPLRGESVVAVINAASAGIGLAVAPCFLAFAAPNLRQVAPQVLTVREIWLVYHPDAARLGRVRAVIDFIVEIVGADRAFLVGAAAPQGDAE